MSGPKIDTAAIERQKAAELEQLRKERSRQIKKATDNLFAVQREEMAFCAEVQNEEVANAQACGDFPDMQIVLAAATAVTGETLQTLRFSMAQPIAAQVEAINLQAIQRKENLRRAKKAHQEKMKPHKARIDQRLRDVADDKTHQAFAESLVKNTQNKPSEVLDVTFGARCAAPVKPCVSQMKTRVNENIAQIETYLNNPLAVQKRKVALSSLAQKMLQYAKVNDEASLQVVETQYQYVMQTALQQLPVMEHLYQQYLAEFVAHKELLGNVKAGKVGAQPKAPHLFVSEEMLENELQNLRTCTKTLSETQYICTQLREVMALFDYDLCEDLILGQQAKGQHYLCSKQGEEIAVHVHVSENHQFMMEILGCETNPEAEDETATIKNASQLEQGELDALLAAQTAFCSMHPKIIKALRERGVLLDEKVHRLPDKKYCKKITRAAKQASATGQAVQKEAVRRKQKNKQEQEATY